MAALAVLAAAAGGLAAVEVAAVRHRLGDESGCPRGCDPG